MTDQSGTNGETCGDTAAKMATKDPKLAPIRHSFFML
jgi:hypothetical protein